MELEKAIGDELRACRHRKKISQEQLGFDASVHRTYVSLIERGVKSPTLVVLFRLCQALDVPPAKFGGHRVEIRLDGLGQNHYDRYQARCQNL